MGLVIGILIGFVAGWLASMQFGPSVRQLFRGSTSRAVHTEKAEDGWQVTQEGSSRTVGGFDTKVEAEAMGDEIAKSAGTDHIIHKADGTVGRERHYGESTTTD